MAQRKSVPKFGEWEESEENYTGIFDQARKKKSGAKMNPKTPQNHSMNSDNVSPVQASPIRMEAKSGAQKGKEPVRTKHVLSASQEDGDLRRPSDSSRPHDAANPKVSSDSALRCHGSINTKDSTKRTVKQNMGSDRRIEHSPLHPQQQAKVGGRVSAMSTNSWERKGSSERSNNLASSGPGRSQLRSATQVIDTPDQGAAVPKFGDWDESDPKSADQFTGVFEKVREEKLNGAQNIAPAKAFHNSYAKGQKQPDDEMSKKCCCFPW